MLMCQITGSHSQLGAIESGEKEAISGTVRHCVFLCLGTSPDAAGAVLVNVALNLADRPSIYLGD